MWACKHMFYSYNSCFYVTCRPRYAKTLVLLAAILEFMMAAFTKLANIINNALNGFIDNENMCLDTNMKSICASDT
jgi:hypothetical protein